MKCPIHNEDLRIEYISGVRTGICLKCPKRYESCDAVRHMDVCDMIKCHTGPNHIGRNGSVWPNSIPGSMDII